MGLMTDDPSPFSGVIREVQGRNTTTPQRGLPKLAHIALDSTNGPNLEASLYTPPTEGMVNARPVAVIRDGVFGSCPICLGGEPDTDEHVPPTAFGGRVMTRTCARCNNGLGSRAEAAMQDWFDGAHRVRVTVDGVAKPLANDRVFLRQTNEGKPLLMMDSPVGPDDDLRRHLNSGGEGLLSFVSPREAEYRTGLLKNAFLAACLYLGHSRPTASAHGIADELLAARDARRRSDVTLGHHAARLGYYRTGHPAHGPTLTIFRGDEDFPRTVISLAGTVLVDWPFPEMTPVAYPTG